LCRDEKIGKEIIEKMGLRDTRKLDDGLRKKIAVLHYYLLDCRGKCCADLTVMS